MPRARALLTASLLLALTSLGGWTYWTSTPTFALRQLVSGIERRDKDLVLRHLEVDAASAQVVGSIIDVESAQAVQRANAKDDADAGFAVLGVAVAQELKPVAARAAAGMFNRALTMWALEPAMDTKDAATMPAAGLAQEFGGGVQTFAGIGATETRGDSASVGVRFAQVGLDTVVTLPVLLRKTGRDWKVVGVRDIGLHLAGLESLRARKLDALNAPIRERLATLVEVGPMQSDVQSSGWLSQTLRTGVEVRNLTDRTIAEVAISARKRVNGEAWWFYSDEEIPPARSLLIIRPVGELNEFDGEHRRILQDPASFALRPSAVIFADGATRDTVRVFRKWDDYVKSLAAAQ